MKILSFNVLAPHLFMHFWSSYACDNPPPETDDKQLASLIEQKGIAISELLILILEKYDPDIVFIQENTDVSKIGLPIFKYKHFISSIKLHEELINLSLLNKEFQLVAEAYKPSSMKWKFPSDEDQGTRNPFSCRTGVSTYVKTYIENKTLFQSVTTKTPITIVEVIDPKTELPIIVVNVHVAMNYPHIDIALEEIYTEIINITGPDISNYEIIIAGDFNANTSEAKDDYYKWRNKYNINSLIFPKIDDIGTDRAVEILPSHMFDVKAKLLSEYNDLLIFDHADPITAKENYQKMGFFESSKFSTDIQRELSRKIVAKNKSDLHPLIVTDHKPLLINIE